MKVDTFGNLPCSYGNKPGVAKDKTTTSPTAQAQAVITKDGFVPATLTMAKGQVVTWINKDSSSHQFSSFPTTAINSLPGFNSEALAPNDSFNFTFERVGSFSYGESANSTKFKGKIIVK